MTRLSLIVVFAIVAGLTGAIHSAAALAACVELQAEEALQLVELPPMIQRGTGTNRGTVQIAIDLGGTKVALGARLVDQKGARILVKVEYPTLIDGKPMTNKAEIEQFVERFAVNLEGFGYALQKAGFDLAPNIGMGSPGKVIDGVIGARSTANLAANDLLAGYPIAKRLAQALNRQPQRSLQAQRPKFEVTVNNDAVAQMAYGLEAMLSRDSALAQRLNNKIVVYAGAGTGLGGGVARVRVNAEGRVSLEIMTDGHIYDVKIPAAGGEIAENLVATPAIHAFGIKGGGKELSEKYQEYLETNRPELAKYADYIETLGQRYGQVVEAIHQGKMDKQDARDNWSPQDVALVKGADAFIIGGSIATKGESGRAILSAARRYLQERGLGHVELIPIKGDSADAGIHGAAVLANRDAP